MYYDASLIVTVLLKSVFYKRYPLPETVINHMHLEKTIQNKISHSWKCNIKLMLNYTFKISDFLVPFQVIFVIFGTHLDVPLSILTSLF